jgi:hypothetical protein
MLTGPALPGGAVASQLLHGATRLSVTRLRTAAVGSERPRGFAVRRSAAAIPPRQAETTSAHPFLSHRLSSQSVHPKRRSMARVVRTSMQGLDRLARRSERPNLRSRRNRRRRLRTCSRRVEIHRRSECAGYDAELRCRVCQRAVKARRPLLIDRSEPLTATTVAKRSGGQCISADRYSPGVAPSDYGRAAPSPFLRLHLRAVVVAERVGDELGVHVLADFVDESALKLEHPAVVVVVPPAVR